MVHIIKKNTKYIFMPLLISYYNNVLYICIGSPEVKISEIFERNAITVTLEWMQGNPSYSYYVDINPATQLLINSNGITRVTVNMSYYIPYNLTILICLCRENLTSFAQSFHYCK